MQRQIVQVFILSILLNTIPLIVIALDKKLSSDEIRTTIDSLFSEYKYNKNDITQILLRELCVTIFQRECNQIYSEYPYSCKPHIDSVTKYINHNDASVNFKQSIIGRIPLPRKQDIDLLTSDNDSSVSISERSTSDIPSQSSKDTDDNSNLHYNVRNQICIIVN